MSDFQSGTVNGMVTATPRKATLCSLLGLVDLDETSICTVHSGTCKGRYELRPRMWVVSVCVHPLPA